MRVVLPGLLHLLAGLSLSFLVLFLGLLLRVLKLLLVHLVPKPVLFSLASMKHSRQVSTQIAFGYARVVRELRRRGELIGTNDLRIGCTSLRLGILIVTVNCADFQRIGGLGIVQYR